MPFSRFCCLCLPFGTQPEPSPEPEPQPRPPKQPTQPAHKQPPGPSPPAAAPIGGDGPGDVDAIGPFKRVFPVQTSYLNPWKACEFLDNTLGEGTWKLEQKYDRFNLIADRDLTDEEHEQLLRIAGKKKVRGV